MLKVLRSLKLISIFSLKIFGMRGNSYSNLIRARRKKEKLVHASIKDRREREGERDREREKRTW